MSNLNAKHRPKNINDVVGQAIVVAGIKAAVKKGDVPHAMLFTGGSGVGKTTLARILANMLDVNDLNIIESNSADSRGIDDVRKLSQAISLPPLKGQKRFVIVDEAQGLTAQAQDALLKVLEECPEHTYIALLTTDKAKLKNTILTRCTEYALTDLDVSVMVEHMKLICSFEGYAAVDTNMLVRIARMSKGSMREALTLLGKCLVVDCKDWRTVLSDDDGVYKDLIAAIIDGDKKAVVQALAKGKEWRNNPEGFRRQLLAACGRKLMKGNLNTYAASAFEVFVDETNLYSAETIPGLIYFSMK